MAVEARRGERDLLGALLEETLGIARETRDLVSRPAPATGDPGSLLAELERAVETGRIATRVSACMAWLLARRAVGAGELTPEQAREREWRLLPLEGELWEEETPAAEAGELARLAARAERLYARVRRLDRSLDAPPGTPSGAPSDAIVEPGRDA